METIKFKLGDFVYVVEADGDAHYTIGCGYIKSISHCLDVDYKLSDFANQNELEDSLIYTVAFSDWNGDGIDLVDREMFYNIEDAIDAIKKILEDSKNRIGKIE
jgi:hypothetical protein